MRNIAFALIFASATIVAHQDRQPVVAVGGAHGLMVATEAPAPTPSGDCPDDCGCGGTGKVGDGRIMVDCGCPSTCKCKGGKGGDVGPSCCDAPVEAVEAPETPVRPVRVPGPRWNWEGLNNPSTAFMQAHLAQDHGIDASGWTREEMQAAHDNDHNGHDPMGGEAAAKAGGFQGGCPGGNCPTSSSGSRRRGLFGRLR